MDGERWAVVGGSKRDKGTESELRDFGIVLVLSAAVLVLEKMNRARGRGTDEDDLFRNFVPAGKTAEYRIRNPES